MRRVFTCNSCQITFEKWFESLHDDFKKTRCPQCKKKKNIIQEFSTNVVCNFLESANSVEKCSDINKKRLGKEQLQIMAEADPIVKQRIEQAKPENRPWYESLSDND